MLAFNIYTHMVGCWIEIGPFVKQGLWRELLQALSKIAKRHRVSTANVALRWVLQQVGHRLGISQRVRLGNSVFTCFHIKS